ncbi:hypothetical protein Srufu_073780 [Streptomyces libani subsp. rufus]|nr:hypothetical protein Srufu_073780 [Streptomyces libani subsp. rufus]
MRQALGLVPKWSRNQREKVPGQENPSRPAISVRGRSAGPVRHSVAATPGRYFLLPLHDAWTNVLACPGTRTTGTGAREFALVGPGRQGELPEVLERTWHTPALCRIG